jgi:cytochrome c peroxidase
MNVRHPFYLLLFLTLLTACTPGGEGDPNWSALQVRIGNAPAAAIPSDLAAQMQWQALPDPNPEEVELGRLLFFDPLLSKDNTISCASCHHPDLGFGDSLGRSIGVSQTPLRRSAMQLWNVGLKSHLTWDGRVTTLEAQMLEGPFFHPDEMGNTPDEMMAKINANPTYQQMFTEIYGGVEPGYAASAISAFQRTLISTNSPFDRYAQGDFYALTGAQRRGFEVFKGEDTNCIQCHELPTFDNEDFKIVGVDDGAQPFDSGRGAITGNPQDDGAFAVPTLRNVALSPPFMHNGVEQNLNDAISFYLNGGGDNLNVPRSALDENLHSFNLNNRGLQDLELFLLALTDESNLPEIPTDLPSGLTPVQPRENPIRAEVEEATALPRGEPRTFNVATGEKIQDAIDRAQPGDTVIVAPGKYYEILDIDVSDITIRGEGVEIAVRPFTPIAITTRNDNITLIGLIINDFPQYNIDRVGGANLRLEQVTLNGQVVTATIP